MRNLADAVAACAMLATVADGGKITYERRIYDVTHLLVQLGALKTKPATL